jgi:hypothetical protein
MFLDHFDTLILKIIFKKYYFNIFINKKYLKKPRSILKKKKKPEPSYKTVSKIR